MAAVKASSGGELGGGSESVVHARVSQVVVEVLDGALACTANDPAQLIDPISSQARQKATKPRDSFKQHHAMFASLLNQHFCRPGTCSNARCRTVLQHDTNHWSNCICSG